MGTFSCLLVWTLLSHTHGSGTHTQRTELCVPVWYTFYFGYNYHELSGWIRYSWTYKPIGLSSDILYMFVRGCEQTCEQGVWILPPPPFWIFFQDARWSFSKLMTFFLVIKSGKIFRSSFARFTKYPLPHLGTFSVHTPGCECILFHLHLIEAKPLRI